MSDPKNMRVTPADIKAANRVVREIKIRNAAILALIFAVIGFVIFLAFRGR